MLRNTKSTYTARGFSQMYGGACLAMAEHLVGLEGVREFQLASHLAHPSIVRWRVLNERTGNYPVCRVPSKHAIAVAKQERQQENER